MAELENECKRGVEKPALENCSYKLSCLIGLAWFPEAKASLVPHPCWAKSEQLNTHLSFAGEPLFTRCLVIQSMEEHKHLPTQNLLLHPCLLLFVNLLLGSDLPGLEN